jgi:hypothetical protein
MIVKNISKQKSCIPCPVMTDSRTKGKEGVKKRWMTFFKTVG